MDSRIERTIQEIKNSGWTLQVTDQKLGWWIDEAFELNSTWNPVGCKIYLLIDVDPDTNSNRKKGENIISVSLSKTIPVERLSTGQFTFYLSELDAKGIQKLVKAGNELRSEN